MKPLRRWRQSRPTGLGSIQGGVLIADRPSILRYVAVRSQRGWGNIRRSVCFAQVARDMEISEAIVAVTLKNAAREGRLRETSPRLLQSAYVSTDRLDRELGLA